ncbi:MAG: alpha/beta hydrolase fold domain-containing protein [Bacillota bacterium]
MLKKLVLSFLVFIMAFTVSVSVDAVTRENRSASSKVAEKIIAIGNTAMVDYGIESQNAFFEEKLEDNQEPYEKPFHFYKTTVTSNEVAELKDYHFEPETAESDKVLLYLHGGAYINRPTFFHFRFVDKLADELNIEAHLPLYPLAPEHTAEDTYEAVIAYYETLLEKYPDKDIIVIGDSAGGGLALGLTQTLENGNTTLPSELVLIAPWLDIRLENPQVDAVEPYDPMLDRRAAQFIGEKWAGDKALTDHQVSPLYGQIEDLPPITLIQGTYDILYPDSELLYEKAKDRGVEIDYHVYEKMAHVFPLYMFVRESQEAYELIVDTLSE